MISESDCILCDPGWVCGTPGLTEHPIDDEFLCPQGFVCGNGTNLFESRVTLCPGGFYCASGTTPYNKFELACLAGYFCPNGTSEITMYDRVCPEGYYCPSSTSGGVHVQLPCLDINNENYDADCLDFKCPEGTTTSTGATSLLQCELDCAAPLCTTLNRTNPIMTDLGYNNLSFVAGTVVYLDVDWTNVPAQMVYYKHFVMNIYYVPSNESMTYINGSDRFLVDTLDDQESKSAYLYPMGEWFKQRDDVIQHKRKFGLNIFYNHQDIDVFVRVEIIHGTYRALTYVFDNTVNVSIFQPQRFRKGEEGHNYAIYAVIKKDDVINEGMALPFNLITNESYDSITVDLASSDDISISDLYQDEDEWDLYHDEMFFEFGYKGSDNRDMLIFPWFPYWSSCLNFESRLHINYMLEGEVNKYTDLDNDTFCKIYDRDTELRPVYTYDFLKNPIADYCNFEIQCQYEEEVGLGTRKRWWEVAVGTTIFYLTREAQSNVAYQDGWTSFSDSYKNKLRYIPVTISKSTQQATDQQQIPTIVTMNLFYYQKDLDTKIIIETYLEYDGWKDVPVDETTGKLLIDIFENNGSVLLQDGTTFDLTYQLNINYQAIGYLDILNNLHFDIFPIYIILYLMVGGFIAAFMFGVWMLKRMCTKLRHPPLLNLTDLSYLYIQPMLSGFGLSLIPAILGALFLYGLYLVEYPFGDIAGNYQDIEELTITRIQIYRSGRLGYAMILFGVYFVIQGSSMIIAEPKQVEFDNIAWSPIKWKRFWLVMVSIAISLFFVYLQQFSYSTIYVNSDNITYFVLLFKFIHLVIYLLLEESFKNSLIVSPFIVTMTCIQIIIIIASKTMISFLMNFLTLFMLQFVERMYLLPYLKRVMRLIPVYNAKIQSRIYGNLGQRYEAERYKSYAQDLIDEIDSRTIEPMIENLNKTSNDILAYLIIPFILYFFILFENELSITDAWNIDHYDMIYFFIFTIIIIGFIMLSDLLLFNAQELYHTFPICNYLRFCRHRFLTRIQHWKLDEFEFDETLDPVLRELDSLCFSSQFYFVNAVTAFGILFIYLGFSVTLANDYPFVSDVFFFILTLFTIFTCMLARRILVYMFRLSQIWKINKLPIIHYAVDEDEKPYDPMQHLRSKPVKNKFLEKNKNWLLSNLAQLITPDALERHRDYLMYHYETMVRQENDGKLKSKYDISDDDDDDDDDNIQQNIDDDDGVKYKSVKLDKRQEHIAIWWLNRGKRLAEMKRLVDGIVASNLDHNCDECNTNDNLQIQQFISIEDLVYEFDKKVKLGINRMDKMHPVIAWRKFFASTQLFRTLCANCMANIQISNIQNKHITLISDDDDDELDFRYEQFKVNFQSISKNIAALWLQGARGRILRQNPVQIPSLSISRSSNQTSLEQSIDDLGITRAPNQSVAIIRDDISSITETETDTQIITTSQSRTISETEESATFSRSTSEDSYVGGRNRRRNNNIQRDDISQDTYEESINDDTATSSDDNEYESPPSGQGVAFYNDQDDDMDVGHRQDISTDTSQDSDDFQRDRTGQARRRYDISSDSEQDSQNGDGY